jgi:hypothetical protein
MPFSDSLSTYNGKAARRNARFFVQYTSIVIYTGATPTSVTDGAYATSVRPNRRVFTFGFKDTPILELELKQILQLKPRSRRGTRHFVL